MSKVFFAVSRHGEYLQKENVPSAYQPYPLSLEGIEKTKAMAVRYLEFSKKNKLEIDSVIQSSPVLRSWQTATVLAEALSSETKRSFVVKSYPALCERCVGSVANLTISEIESLLELDPRFEVPAKGWKSDSHYCLPFLGAESLIDAGDRVAEHLAAECVKQKARKKDVLKIVTGHGAAIRHAAYFLGLLLPDEIEHFSMHHSEPLFIRAYKNKTKPWELVEGQWKERARVADKTASEIAFGECD